jgi:Icc-related predicted phosphoesterase
MKLLLFSDIHTDKNHAQNLVNMSAKADLVIGAGDYGSLRRGINKTIQWLSEINKPTVLVSGNAESYEELKKACSQWPSATVLHGTDVERLGITFFGIGGGIPITPFGSWSYDLTEEEAAALLINCPEDAALTSHSPPEGILDVSSAGKHLGSKSIRQAIEQKSPRLVVCGHIHESGGKRYTFGETTVINAGPRGIFYEIGEY